MENIACNQSPRLHQYNTRLRDDIVASVYSLVSDQ